MPQPPASSAFVWFQNYAELFHSSNYLESFKVTAVFSVLVLTCERGLITRINAIADPRKLRHLAPLAESGPGR